MKKNKFADLKNLKDEEIIFLVCFGYFDDELQQ